MALVADNNGRLTGEFTIPNNIPAGSKTVVFTGKGGTNGRAIYVGRGTILTRIFRRVFTTTTVRWWQRSDPLAQTFTLNQGRHITSVDVEFCKIGKRNNPVIVQIRETDTGMPTQEVVAEATLSMGNVKTGRWTRCKFKAPVWLEDGVEYALVFMSDDADHALATAQLGKFDRRHQKWMTEQPYQVGVLLSSSNASTWTPHQATDLTFRLNAARFTAKQRIVDFGSIKVEKCSDILVEAGIEEPAVDTSVMVRITRANGRHIHVHPGQTVRFDNWITETLKIAFVLRGSNIHSPVLYPLIHVIQGELQAEGDYVSRAMPAGDKVQAMITFDCHLPGHSSVKVEVGGEGDWREAALEDTTPLGDGKQERTYRLPKYVARDARIKLTLSGNPASRPQLSALRSNITDQPRNITE